MKNNFEFAYNFMAPHEYTHTNFLSKDPNDPGGVTKYGISKRAYPELDIENLTKEEAKYLTWRDYWEKTNLDLINSKEIGASLLDFFFHSGTDEVLRIQKLLKNEFRKNISLDGFLGPQTATAINSINPKEFGISLNNTRLKYLKSLKVWDSFKTGFTKRLEDNFRLFTSEKKK